MQRNDTNIRDHFVQFYDDDAVLIDSVAAFMAANLASEGAGVVVATEAHRAALESRLSEQGIDLASARSDRRYVDLDAAETLQTILVDGWPDTRRFFAQCEPIVEAAARGHANVAIFAEMVALLWAQGKHGGAVRLEQLWNELGSRHSFALFCAYPIADVAEAPSRAMDQVCAEHARAIPSESYSGLQSDDARLAEVCKLQRKAHALQTEVRRRKAIEVALAKRESELSDFLDNAPQPIHSVDPDGGIVWANQFELDFLGYAPA